MDYNALKRLYVLLVVVLVIVFVCCVINYSMSDREAPVITINQDQLPASYSDDMDLSELLTGVTAYDKKDGDVTANVFVVNMIVLGDGQQVKVTYAVKDSHNNIAKKNVLINYTGTQKFIEVVSDEDLMSSSIAEENDTDAETPTEGETIDSDTPALGGSGTPVQINQEDSDSTGIPQIELKYTDYTIRVGDSFSTVEALDMVNATYDDKEAVSNRIVISGIANIDVNQAGDYVLNYSVSDTDGNRSETQALTLHVIE